MVVNAHSLFLKPNLRLNIPPLQSSTSLSFQFRTSSLSHGMEPLQP